MAAQHVCVILIQPTTKMVRDATSVPLRKRFEQFQERAFLLVRPGGNYGDSLIYQGAEHLADEIGCTWKSLTADEFLGASIGDEHVIYLHGGGGFNPFYAGLPLRVLKHALQHHDGPIIQGPQTFDVSNDYLVHVRNELMSVSPEGPAFLYVRERTSHEALADLVPPTITLGLDHDTAFHVERTDVLRSEPRSYNRYTLHAIRQDKEKQDTPFDINTSVQLDPAQYARSYDHWIRLHATSREIVTNRTHSAILGAILEIPTTLLPNAYHKNRSVWEYSLKSHGVAWSEWPEPLESGRQTTFNLLQGVELPGLVRIAQSTKLRRLRLFLKGVPWK